MIGSELEGRYRIEAELGSGGVGAVYRGVHLALGRAVAIKVLRSEYSSSAEQRQRFEREARALASMSHPNIVAVTDFGVSQDVAYIVMDLLEGQTLAQRIKKGGALSVPDALGIMRQLLRALAFVHEQGLVHRDVKPPNVFLQSRPDGEVHVRLLDFGLAKVLSKDPTVKNLTRAGQIFGTPSYMAPEQVAGQEADARTDVYAAGIVLFEMLAGRAPFKGTAAEIFRQHLMEDMPMDALLPAEARSPELDALISKATAKTRADRHSDAADLLAAIEALPRSLGSPGASGGTPRTVPVPPPSSRAFEATAVEQKKGEASDVEASLLTAVPISEGTGEAATDDLIEDISAHEIPADELPFEPEAPQSPPRPTRTFGGSLFRSIALVAVLVSLSALAAAAYAVHVYTTPAMANERQSLDRALGLAPPGAAPPAGDDNAERPADTETEAPSAPPTDSTTKVATSAPAERLRDEAAAEEHPPNAQQPPPPIASAATSANAEAESPSRPRAPVANPWATTPRELAGLLTRVNRGKTLEKRDLLKVHEFNARKPDDARGHLLLARAYSNRHWFKDAANEYGIALKVNDNARGDPRMLPDLLRIVEFGSTEAERLVKDIFGETARGAVDKALLTVDGNPEAKMRLERLRSEL